MNSGGIRVFPGRKDAAVVAEVLRMCSIGGKRDDYDGEAEVRSVTRSIRSALGHSGTDSASYDSAFGAYYEGAERIELPNLGRAIRALVAAARQRKRVDVAAAAVASSRGVDRQLIGANRGLHHRCGRTNPQLSFVQGWYAQVAS